MRDMYTEDVSTALFRVYKRHNITPAEALDLESEFAGDEKAIVAAIAQRTMYRRPGLNTTLRYHTQTLAGLRGEVL